MAEIHFSDAVLRLSTQGNLMMATWFNAPEMQHMREMDAVNRAMKERHAEGVGFVNLIVSGTPPV